MQTSLQLLGCTAVIVGSLVVDERRPRELSEDCRIAVSAINDQAYEKFAQIDSARKFHPEVLAELEELYPLARDVWNKKAGLIEKNGPGYSAGFGPLYGDGSEFTTDDVDLEVHRFFNLLALASYEASFQTPTHDIVGAVAVENEGKFMPETFHLLRRLKNQCRVEHELVMKAFKVTRLPERFEDF